MKLEQQDPTENTTVMWVSWLNINIIIITVILSELVNEDIGFQYGKSATFPVEGLATSSDQFDEEHPNPPPDGRLYKPWKFWCPVDPLEPSYLELILAKKYYIFAVSVQGQPPTSSNNFMMNLAISYSNNYARWEKYMAIFRVSNF